MSAGPSGVLEASGLGVAFGPRQILAGVGFALRAGELCVVLGPNGAGKSTLLRACLGLLPLSAGEVRVAGRPLAGWSREALARTVAWVPQLALIEGFTALEVVLMGRTSRAGAWGGASAGEVQRAREALEDLGIGELAGRPMEALSGGEARLVLVARALVQEPLALLLDEPTAHLDLRHQVRVLERLKERARAGLAVLAVLHDVNLASAFADRVLLLGDGGLCADGPPGEVLHQASLERLYGLPMGMALDGSGQRLFAPRLERSG